MVDISLHGEHVTGAALARPRSCHHSSAPFPQKFKEERVERETEKRQGPRRPRTARRVPEWPGGLSSSASKKTEVAGWQERVQRHCVEHLADICPFVQVLDADAPLPIEQCAEIWNLEDEHHGPRSSSCIDRLPSRLTKYSGSRVHRVLYRVPVSEPQTAEQLVEVPLPSCLPCSRLPSRPLAFQFRRVVVVVLFKVLSQDRVQQRLVLSQSVDIRVRGGLHGFLLGQKLTQRTVEQLVDSSSGGLQDFHLGQGSTASPSSPRVRLAQGRFSHFSPAPRKVRRKVLPPGRELAAHSSSSTLGAYGVVSSLEEPVQEEKEEHEEVHLPNSIEWVQLCDDKGKTCCWNRRTRTTRWKPPPGIRVVWVGTEGSRGGLFYWHKDTCASSKTLPPLPPG